MADNPPLPRLSVEEMRQRFNDDRYWERVQAGELHEEVISIHPNTAYPEVLGRFPGAVSVTAHYRDAANNTVAEVHYFRMPDGSVAPGMRPDPKLLLVNGLLHHLEKKKARERRLAAEAINPGDTPAS